MSNLFFWFTFSAAAGGAPKSGQSALGLNRRGAAEAVFEDTGALDAYVRRNFGRQQLQRAHVARLVQHEDEVAEPQAHEIEQALGDLLTRLEATGAGLGRRAFIDLGLGLADD